MTNKYENLANNIDDISEVEEPGTVNRIFGKYVELLRTEEGLCFGLVFMWGRAILLNGERTFFARLDLLTRDYQRQPFQFFGRPWNNFGELLLTCSQTYIRNPQVLAGNPELDLLLSVRAFLDGVLLYLSPDESSLYKEKIKKNLYFQNPSVTAEILGHDLISTFRKPFVGTIDNFKILFQKMILDLKHSPDSPFFITISTDNHIIGVKLNQRSCLIFIPHYLHENRYIWNIENTINVTHMIDDLSNEIFQIFEKTGEKPPPHHQSFHRNYLNTVIEIWTLNECHSSASRFAETQKWYFEFYLPQMIARGSRFRGDFLMNLVEYCPHDAGLLESFLINLHDDQLSFLHHSIFLKACRNGYLAIVLALLAHPAKFRFNINEIMLDGYGPLHWAAKEGQAQIVRALLTRSPINANAIQKGYSALALACTLGHLSVVEVFLSPEFKFKVNINEAVTQEFSPLGGACKNGFVNIILLLLQNGARVSRGIIWLYRMSTAARVRERPDIIEKLEDLCL